MTGSHQVGPLTYHKTAMHYPSISNIMSPAEFEALRNVKTPVQQALNDINAALADPGSLPSRAHPYTVPFFYLEAEVQLTYEEAQTVLRICRESGWKHVQIAYTPVYVEVRLCNEEAQRFRPSWYQNENGHRRELTAP